MGIYTRSSKTRYYTKEENIRFQRDIREYRLEMLRSDGCETPGRSLLDSSLISRTNIKNGTIKIIQCGDYYQVYTFSNSHEIIDKNLVKMKDKKYCMQRILAESREDISEIDTDLLVKKTNKKIELKTIEEKNIRRSKAQLQRIVKSNETEFNTFITLTYADNITDISIANKNFDNWRRSIKRIKSNFKYVCVPEFQKRGAVHYHILTNLDIKEDCNLIIPQEGKTTQYDVKYWRHGYTSVFPVKNINVVGYMSKYMTKDIDDRLWGKRRYLYSQNLKTPTTLYLNLDNIEDFRRYVDIVNSCNLNYQNIYSDLNGELIEFEEYKLKVVYA